MDISLYDYQADALTRMSNGCILCGVPGSGKSRTGLAYYYTQCGGGLTPRTKMKNPLDLYIITTAKKRDEHEWESEMDIFLLSPVKELMKYPTKVVIDSWNNIGKYKKVKDGFFIFDEQRVVGHGKWVTVFIEIAKHNQWILLSGTPGDNYEDYIPVFMANGFFKSRTEFYNRHTVRTWQGKYYKTTRYLETRRLDRLCSKILVEMDYHPPTQTHDNVIDVPYDISAYKAMIRKRVNPYTQEPILNASEFCYTLRRIVNSDPSRAAEVRRIVEARRKVIVFYNHDYELDILRGIEYSIPVEIAEWNGHKHQPIPKSSAWVYLVQYTAGAEGWNCTKTDSMIFYSQTYSYKQLKQAKGRINRVNTPFTDLYYYHLKSHAGIDISISRALKEKKQFNERKFMSSL